nr:unnamed protein product [uncultured bacterium]
MIKLLNEKMYDRKDLRELLHVSDRTLTQMKKRGELVFTRIGRTTYVSERNLWNYIQAQTTKRETERNAIDPRLFRRDTSSDDDK